METEGLRVCQEPTSFYLMGVALRSFFLVLATHLLAGEVDTTLAAGVPLTRRISWWCRYYNPLNLSWRYYSMFAYRFIAHSWGTPQLALINHEEHPLLPPLPYILGETVRPLHVRRLEMAGLLSSQGILTFSAAYQGALAIQYAISTEGIPYLPNTTVPLAMVGLFRVMASKWVASKIQVDAYPYPCVSSSSVLECFRLNNCLNSCRSLPSAQMSKSSTDSSSTSSPITKPSRDPSSASSNMTKSNGNPSLPSLTITKSYKEPLSIASAIPKSHRDPSLSPPTVVKLNTDPSSSLLLSFAKSYSFASITLPFSKPPPLVLPSSSHRACPSSPLSYPPSPSISQLQICPSLPTISRPFSPLSSSPRALGSLSSADVPPLSSRTYTSSLSKSSLLPTALPPSEMSKANTSSSSCAPSSLSYPFSAFVSSTGLHTSILSSPPSLVPSHVCQVHPPSPLFSSAAFNEPLDYKSNKFVVGAWIGVLVGLVTMSFLPYKVVAAYQLPHSWLQFSMQLFYQYIAVSELVFHAYLLFQGPRALANRVLFFDHWTFKAQTAGFFLLLTFMLVTALIDFVKHEFYRRCA